MKKFSENSGNMAEISTNDETFLGTLMPSGNPGVVVLKSNVLEAISWVLRSSVELLIERVFNSSGR